MADRKQWTVNNDGPIIFYPGPELKRQLRSTADAKSMSMSEYVPSLLPKDLLPA